MKGFTDFLGYLDGRLSFIACAVVIAAVFIFSLVVMITKRKHLSIGCITAITAVASGISCYFMTLCTKDAQYAAGNAVFIIAGGCFLGMIGAVVSYFTLFLPKNEEECDSEEKTTDKAQVSEPEKKEKKENKENAVSTEVLPLEVLMLKEEKESVVSDVILPQSASPDMGYEEVLVRAEQAEKMGIGLTEAKAIVTQISKLKLLTENATDARRKALSDAQRKIVSSVRN